MTNDDSIVDRAERVRHSLEGVRDPARVQAAVGGPCPACGKRVELVLRPDSWSFSCESCGHAFEIDR